MATKTFNGRIQHKYDSYQAWYDANPVLLSGEPCFITVAADTGAVEQEPVVLIKVGDGITAWRDLPWISAKAADISDWAKAATKPTYSASEITGMADYISQYVEDTMGITTDTNTVYRITKVDDNTYKLQSKGAADADTAWADVVDGTITIPETDTTELSESIDEINATIGAVEEGKTVVEMIEDAKTAATYDDTALSDRVTVAEDQLTTLIGDDEDKSVRTIANEELAARLIPADAQESLNTLEEVAAWIQDHPDDAAAMNAAIAALETKVTLGTDEDGNEYATVKAYVEAAISALGIGDYAKAAELTALAARVEALENKAHEHTNADVLDGITAEKVTEWDTVSDKANDADLADVAKSGNVDDLVQTDDTYFVINCGTATTVI